MLFQIRRAFDLIFRHIVGASRPAADLRAAVWQSIFTHDMRRYRRSLYRRMHDVTTLITGPSGTGKELVARAIGLSRYIPFDPDREAFVGTIAGSFHALNLSALSPTLIESELFGHRKGAFTGALEDRVGWLESCPPHGTVLLDEIGEVDAAIQVKLLRVLQTREFQRIGETTPRAFRGKLIAATNRDLETAMHAGRFREDLLMNFRLCMVLIGTVCAVALLPGVALAQSAIAGAVTDNTGGVLPGVTVEVASPVLIEGVRTAVTGGEGRYNVIDLRPGTYTVTFSLPGFGTVVREGLNLPADFTATVNAQLSVGALEESVTVSGESPVVDVQSAARRQTLDREVLDSIPTSRTGQGMGAIIVGVRLNRPDMGGTRATENSRMYVHGSDDRDVNVNVDGLSIDAQDDNGIQGYYNEAMVQEVAYTTSAISADSAKGGVRMNMIAQEGGNVFSGNSYLSTSPSSWQSDNLSQDLIDRGLPSPDSIAHVSDLAIAQGGPIMQNKLWFYIAARQVKLDEVVAGTFYLPEGMPLNHIVPTSGDPAIGDQFIKSASARLTYQAAPSSKISLYFDRAFKNKNHSPSPNDDPATAASYRPWRTHTYYTSSAKLTSTLSSRLLWETGYSGVLENRVTTSQPGINQPRDTPAWIANARRYDFVTDRFWKSYGLSQATEERFMISSSLSYVTGAHNIKGGVQWFFGPDGNANDRNADLTQRYRFGVPENVDVTYPLWREVYLNADLGLYLQDSWTIDRLTINPGVRLEYFNASLAETFMPAGRFLPARIAPASDAIPPPWWDVSPRFSMVYDLFGDARTAVKFSASKYMRPIIDEITLRYSPVFSDSDRRDWTDTNGNDIAQTSEIGPSNDQNFGIRPGRTLDPNFQREYNWEYSASLQHELVPGVSVTTAWYRRAFYDMWGTENTLVETSDYTLFQATNPIDGTPVDVYNLDPAKRGLSNIRDFNSDTNSQVYNGVELSFQARIPGGGTFFGGTTTERTILNTCDTDDPNDFRYCDQSELDIPWLTEYKLAGYYPLPGGIVANMSLISWPGTTLTTRWSVPRSQFPNGQRTQSVNVNLAEPGTKYTDRYTQFDVGIKKIFQFGGLEVHGDFTVFNALNTAAVLAENTRFGSSLGQPQRIAQGRLPRIAAQLKW